MCYLTVSSLEVSRAFSDDLKWRIVYLYHDGYNQKKIAKLLHISKCTVDKVLQIYVQWGTMVNPWQKLPGCHKTLTRNEMKILQELVKDKLHQAAYERNELLRSTFIAEVGHDYKSEQLIFMDETAKDKRSLSQGYRYSFKNTFTTKKIVLVLDNARIHHDENLIEYIEAFSGRVEFLPHIHLTLILLKPVFPL
ncbi:helix-turn-helix domain-containing protein [Rhizophagus clarus]|uniref:Helix-turn-helix domain-containing protein n=1 Tax=Rhizophagus clarus TaxID=94130 RepID=A0A8H3QXN8_9GLOM|nr:helix-turn-helix domain-containing protein [Rhizophagus clarus]